MQKINDPAFGALEYNPKGYLEKKISMTIWGMDEELDLTVQDELIG